MRARWLTTALVAAMGCHTGPFSIGEPADGGLEAETGTTGGPTTITCPSLPDRATVASLDPTLGVPRALAADGTSAYVLLEREDDHTGTLVRIDLAASASTVLARVGAGPVAIALDDHYAYVASSTAGEIARIGKRGDSSTTIGGQDGAAGIATDGHLAFWTLPAAGAVGSVDFDSAGTAPARTALGGAPRAMALGQAEVVFAGDRALRAIAVADPGSPPRTVATRCDGEVLAIDRETAFCVEANALLAVRLDGSEAHVIASGLGAIASAAASGGRAFFVARGGATLVWAVPTDGIGGPTVLGPLPGPSPLAADGCAVYFAAGTDVIRRAL